ncbi:MAG TPA: phosphoribosylamine--glycine ligase [bacterium]|nr:phosphoribosylamine--glycine ligase [bacterium]
MNVLVIGGGGREHALVWKLSQSPRIRKVYCAPGNGGTPGTGGKAENVAVKPEDLPGLVSLAREKKIDLTVVGPELPLTLGLSDLLEKEKIPVFGPNKAASVLEGSKAWTKRFLRDHSIPTAHYESFDDFDRAVDFLNTQSYPVVVKADGLAAGKGVVIAKDRAEAVGALESILKMKIFGEAGRTVVIEEFLNGEEASFLALVDGASILPLDSSQDHKRVGEGDTGPNTGGMGVYSPAPVVTDGVRDKVIAKILTPTLKGLKAMGIDYRGVLYAGLMIDRAGEPKLLEYNVRFGDPETQALMVRWDGDLLEDFEATVTGRLSGRSLRWKPGASVCVVMAAHGYPGEITTGDPIQGLKEAGTVPETVVFHAGTKKAGEEIVTSGGRVLGVTALGRDLRQARERAYDACEKIYWRGAHYRRDIGMKAIGRKI